MPTDRTASIVKLAIVVLVLAVIVGAIAGELLGIGLSSVTIPAHTARDQQDRMFWRGYIAGLYVGRLTLTTLLGLAIVVPCAVLWRLGRRR